RKVGFEGADTLKARPFLETTPGALLPDCRHPTGMRRIAAEPVTGDPNQQGVWPSDRRTSYAYSPRTARGASAAGRIADSWQASSSRRFPQLSGVLPWQLCCRAS